MLKFSVCCANAVPDATIVTAAASASRTVICFSMSSLQGPIPSGPWRNSVQSGCKLRTDVIAAIPGDYLEHRFVHVSVGGDEVGGHGIERRPVHPGDAPAGLGHDEGACRDIPRLEVLLPEGVESSRRDV